MFKKISYSFIKLRHKFIVVAFIAMLVASFGCETNAQKTVTGAFQGAVVDSITRNPLEGVSVRIVNDSSGIEFNLLTDKKGEFYQGSLPPGLYVIQFTAQEYRSVQIRREMKVSLQGILVPYPISLVPIKIQSKSTEQPLITGNLAVASLPNTTITIEALDKSSTYRNVILPDQLLTAFDKLPIQKYSVNAVLEGYQPLRKEVGVLPNRTSTVSLNLLPNEASSRIREQAGRYYALIIGSNNYQYFSPLKTAEIDAKEVDFVLRENYGFETKLLLNATREQIIVALNEYRRKLEPNSNLLIYYAGHGYKEEEEGAYWIPVNARKEDNANWISADDITRNIKLIPAKHILVVSDSCYSGALSRNSDIVSLNSSLTGREKFLLKMSEGKSRTLLASGGDEPVLDGGGGIHSVFASAFLIGLLEADKEIFTADEFYIKSIKEVVAGKANQNPVYSAIRNSGHESGGFIFIRKK